MSEENKEKPKANVFVDREIQTREENREYKEYDAKNKRIRIKG